MAHHKCPGTVQMEWHQTPRNHVIAVFDKILLIPLQPLPRARPPQLRCNQPPVISYAVFILGNYRIDHLITSSSTLFP
jgi:hypothetical protein